jgi:hypothetical protein
VLLLLTNASGYRSIAISLQPSGGAVFCCDHLGTCWKNEAPTGGEFGRRASLRGAVGACGHRSANTRLARAEDNIEQDHGHDGCPAD